MVLCIMRAIVETHGHRRDARPCVSTPTPTPQNRSCVSTGKMWESNGNENNDNNDRKIPE